MPEGYNAVGYSHGHIVYEREDGKFVLWNIKEEKFVDGNYDTIHLAMKHGDGEPVVDSVDSWLPDGVWEKDYPKTEKTLWQKIIGLFK